MSEAIFITGANGEVGHALIPKLSEKKYQIFALDVNELDAALKPLVSKFFKGSILAKSFLSSIIDQNNISCIFHLAAILSTGGEKDPEKAQLVNAQGTAIMLEVANTIARKRRVLIKFIFPSTVAVYGLPDLETKSKIGKINEEQYNSPITMYGVNKLYGEMLGKYYAKNYKMLEGDSQKFIDFRCVRFPGIISALTLPTGGTSDYAPEMIHSGAQGVSYETFVRPDTTLPFMVMPDAVKALISLSEVAKEKLKMNVYNVAAFSTSAQQIEKLVNAVFPNSAISYNPDPNRQKIVDSWPADLDDSNARKDWGWKADFDINRAFSDYLIPEITNRYK